MKGNPVRKMANRVFFGELKRYYLWYTGGFLLFLVALSILEKEGVPRIWIGYLFMFATSVLYASIGLLSRTSDVSEYYVAGRRVPALFNGMATAADWLSAASFISLAGGLYLQGFDGLAYIMGWTGGFCLVALLIAPFLRKFGQYTIPDFLAARYTGRSNGNLVRMLAVVATVVVSFTYVVAQIYGVGLIASRFTGVDFSVGIFLGLASILVCSFLGGMRAITWTQVAQYIIILIAYMIPVIWLSAKHTSVPIPQITYGSVLSKLSAREKALEHDPKEIEVRAVFAQRAKDYETRLNALPKSWEEGRVEAQHHLEELKMGRASLIEIKAAATLNRRDRHWLELHYGAGIPAGPDRAPTASWRPPRRFGMPCCAPAASAIRRVRAVRTWSVCSSAGGLRTLLRRVSCKRRPAFP